MSRDYLKPALTFEQQLELLERRGMTVTDRSRALRALQHVSYYRLSAYWYPYRSGKDGFEPSATFEGALRLYEFDRRLRLLALDAIERVEVNVRTRVTYALAHAYGAFAHEDAATFDSSFGHTRWFADVRKEIARASESFLDHYKTSYAGWPRIPIWMASEVMSLRTLSLMFSGMRTKEQEHVVFGWGIHRSVATSWLHTLTYVRNVCAHHGRLWNRELSIRPQVPKHDPAWMTVSNRRIYGVLCVLRQLTSSDLGGELWATSARKLLIEFEGEPRWQNAMGVPRDWATRPFWSPSTPG